MASTAIRVETAERLLDLLRADPSNAGVLVRYGAPVEEIGEPAIFVQSSGEEGATTAHMRAGRKHRTDQWDLQVWCTLHVAPDDEYGLDAARRVQTMWATVEDVCADNPTLAVDGDGLAGLMWVMQDGRSDGPRVSPTETGFVAWWEGLITCRARLT
jgi:hypothetical protein